MKKPLNMKTVAIAALIIPFMVAIYYEFRYCGGELFHAVIIYLTTIALPIIFFIASYYWATTVACIVMIIPEVWAYRVECMLPYSGGGAPMAFLALPFYGAPVALLLGAISAIIEYLLRKKNAGKP